MATQLVLFALGAPSADAFFGDNVLDVLSSKDSGAALDQPRKLRKVQGCKRINVQHGFVSEKEHKAKFVIWQNEKGNKPIDDVLVCNDGYELHWKVQAFQCINGTWRFSKKNKWKDVKDLSEGICVREARRIHFRATNIAKLTQERNAFLGDEIKNFDTKAGDVLSKTKDLTKLLDWLKENSNALNAEWIQLNKSIKGHADIIKKSIQKSIKEIKAGSVIDQNKLNKMNKLNEMNEEILVLVAKNRSKKIEFSLSVSDENEDEIETRRLQEGKEKDRLLSLPFNFDFFGSLINEVQDKIDAFEGISDAVSDAAKQKVVGTVVQIAEKYQKNVQKEKKITKQTKEKYQKIVLKAIDVMMKWYVTLDNINHKAKEIIQAVKEQWER